MQHGLGYARPELALGARGDGANYDGLMSHAHFTDGYAYDAPKGYSPADKPTFPQNSNKNNYDETLSTLFY